MAVPKKAFVLSSAVITFFTLRYAPHVAVYPKSFFWNAVTLLFVQLSAQFCWSVFVYPFYFSPLRHLPQAPVRTFLTTSRPHVVLLIPGVEWKFPPWSFWTDFQGAFG